MWFSYVPLTSSYQTIGAKPAPELSFKVQEFTPPFPYLQLNGLNPTNLMMSIYFAAGTTLQVGAGSALRDPIHWVPYQQVSLSNNFLLLQMPIGAEARRLFRVEAGP